MRFSSWETTWTEDRAQRTALVTRFDTFESRYYAAEEEHRNFEAEQRNEWAQRCSFEKEERVQRRSFKEEQRAEWTRVAAPAFRDLFSSWWPLSIAPVTS